jgi:serine protease SohB
MQHLAEYGLFLAKTITFVIAILLIISGVVGLMSRARNEKSSHRLELKKINEDLDHLKEQMLATIFSKKEYKKWQKSESKKHKANSKEKKPRVFILNFEGDPKASQVTELREEISAILQIAQPEDEVVLKLESPGGVVHGYGLAASQLQRLRDQQISLTIIVDKVAASGGYMMACVANKLIAAPFAIIGSIGVVLELPNFNRLLKKYNIDYEQLTAGEYKRTLSILGENTDQGRTKMKAELEVAHQLFKSFIGQHRPTLDLSKVATGEHWFGIEAKTLGLVDENQTSDDYLLKLSQTAELYSLQYHRKKSLGKRLSLGLQNMLQSMRIGW